MLICARADHISNGQAWFCSEIFESDQTVNRQNLFIKKDWETALGFTEIAFTARPKIHFHSQILGMAEAYFSPIEVLYKAFFESVFTD